MKPAAFVFGIFLLSASTQAAEVAELAWLTGHWRQTRNGRLSEETWSAPAGGMLLGTNRVVRENGSGSFEFLRIGTWKETLAYYASPGGRPATPFALVSSEPNAVTFENPEHDFPQRILYRRVGDKLTARIEGMVDGKRQSHEWEWTRVPPAGTVATPTTKLHGLRTVVYKVPNLKQATAWYQKVTGIDPYFEEPYYVGFNVGGYELGLDPDMEGVSQGNNQPAYWGVNDCQASYARLIELGGVNESAPRDVGDGIKVATVRDPFGNLFGIIENPHFRLP